MRRIQLLTFVIIGLVGAVVFAKTPLTCEIPASPGGEKIRFEMRTPTAGVLIFEGKPFVSRCFVEIKRVEDNRMSLAPSVDVLFVRHEACETRDPSLEASLLKEGRLILALSEGKHQGSLNILKLAGYQSCRLSGYSRTLLRLPEEPQP